jgi:hypothetical protein
MNARVSHVTVLVFVVAQLSGAAQRASLEHEVKAAFVLNFTRYVDWPAARRAAPFRLCVLRDAPFSGRLASVVTGENWHGGAIEVEVVTELRQTQDCHLLYVPAVSETAFAAGQSQLHGRPVLTVGEHDHFLDHDGMIRLFVDQNKVRFSINQRAASAAGLQISSRLLRLAREVIGMVGPR